MDPFQLALLLAVPVQFQHWQQALQQQVRVHSSLLARRRKLMRIRLDMATPGQPAGSRPPRPTEPQPAPPLLSSSSLPASASASAAAAGPH